MTDDQHTRPSSETRAEEERDAQVRSGPSRGPRPDEAEAAERARADQPGDVAEHYEEMRERGAKQPGEGRIEP
jgi:hypothetical protein